VQSQTNQRLPIVEAAWINKLARLILLFVNWFCFWNKSQNHLCSFPFPPMKTEDFWNTWFSMCKSEGTKMISRLIPLESAQKELANYNTYYGSHQLILIYTGVLCDMKFPPLNSNLFPKLLVHHMRKLHLNSFFISLYTLAFWFDQKSPLGGKSRFLYFEAFLWGRGIHNIKVA